MEDITCLDFVHWASDGALIGFLRRWMRTYQEYGIVVAPHSLGRAATVAHGLRQPQVSGKLWVAVALLGAEKAAPPSDCPGKVRYPYGGMGFSYAWEAHGNFLL